MSRSDIKWVICQLFRDELRRKFVNLIKRLIYGEAPQLNQTEPEKLHMKVDSFILEALPNNEQRDRFQHHATEIVSESFILTGDRDYLTARFAYFQKQSHLFFWSAAQTLEKYLKANLLLRGPGKIERIHEHTKLANSLRHAYPDLLKIDMAMPEAWEMVCHIQNWPCSTVDDFLRRLEIIGSPDVRYDQVRLEVNLQDLVLLDRLAFRLRNQLIRESVQDCKLVGEQLKSCFLDLNDSFAPPDYQHPSLQGVCVIHESVSALEAALKGLYGFAPQYESWFKQAMGYKEGPSFRRVVDRLKIAPKAQG